jgi:hypothetical protein
MAQIRLEGCWNAKSIKRKAIEVGLLRWREEGTGREED